MSASWRVAKIRLESPSSPPVGDPGIPHRLPLGELLRRKRRAGRFAPDIEKCLSPVRPASRGRPRSFGLGRDALPAAVFLLLCAASFGALFVGEVEPGPPALDPVGSALVAVMALGAGSFGRDVHGGSLPCGESAAKGVFVVVSYGFIKRGKGGMPGAAAIAARIRASRLPFAPQTGR